MNFSFNASVIVATFNRKEILKQVLEHLDGQKGEYSSPFEVIVVDDGSTDNTKEFMKKIMENKTYHYPISYFNTGLTDTYGVNVARNIGIKNSRGKYLLFLDDDCIPHENWVHAHVTMLEAGEKVVVGYISHKKEILEKKLPITIDNPVMKRLYKESREDKLSELLSGNLALSRQCFKQSGMFDERFAHFKVYGYDDIEFGHRLLIGGFKIKFNPNAVVYTQLKDFSNNKEREDMKNKAKMVWWHIVTHPQEGLPITPLLYLYARHKIEEFKVK